MNSFAEIELHKQWIDFDEIAGTYSGIQTPSLQSLRQLISADSDEKISSFVQEWFPFMSYIKSWEHPSFDDECVAAKNTRDLMILVLELKSMVDEDLCSKEMFERLGVRFRPGGAKRCEQAHMHYLVTSDTLAKTIRSYSNTGQIEESFKRHVLSHEEEHRTLLEKGYMDPSGGVFCPFAPCSYALGSLVKRERLYLHGQEATIEKIEDNLLYPVMNFFGGNLGKIQSCSSDRAFFLIDSILEPCMQGIMIRTKDGVLYPRAETNFTSFWICLSEVFRDSRVAICKCCRLPIIASNERGSKRQYCNSSCKRKYKRALKFRNLVLEEGLTEAEAAKEAGISPSTANRILG